uniref:Apple domain-containing protein n=1 Tax=Romanomermis culicivorax TaxID=13658 RepID=A0A915IXQ1_ROMCU
MRQALRASPSTRLRLILFDARIFCSFSLTSCAKVSCRPPEYIVQDTKQNPVFCRVQSHHGFHVYNPVALLKTENRYDCILACKRHGQCQTSNFVRKSKLCFLHSSKLNSARQAIGRDLVPSILSMLHCGQDTAPSKDQTAGIPAETCGTPHFPPGDLTLFENRRFRRILGGFISQPYAYPWLGIVLRNNYHTCSLSLVSRNRNDKATVWAVSAAHCFMDQGKQ